MNTKHTPGPWNYSISMGVQVYAYTNKKKTTAITIANLPTPDTYLGASTNPELLRQQQENAKLIAAAPDMLIALQALEGVEAWINNAEMKRLVGKTIGDAIAKATL